MKTNIFYLSLGLISVLNTQAQTNRVAKFSGTFVPTGLTQSGIFESGGLVGIGTTSPSTALTVNTSTGYGITHTTGTVSLATYIDANGGWLGTRTNHPLFFYTNGGLAAATLATNGNIGIGTTSPGSRLTVNGAGGNTVDLSVNGRIRTGDANNLGGIWVNTGTQFFGQLDANKMGIWNSGWRVIVDNAGNLGVGTASPEFILDVNGRSRFRSAGGRTAGIWFNNMANTDGRAFVGMADDDHVGLWGNGGLFWFMTMDVNNGKVNIGNVSTAPSGYKLFVESGILTEKVKVALKTSGNWADHVFADSYKLKSLSEVESFIKTNKHLEGIPSADDLVKDGGVDVNQMFAKQMEKIEELTLYLIDMKKEIETLKCENSGLKAKEAK